MPGEETAVEHSRRRPRGLAGAYLQQAVDALSAAGDPDRLYPRWAREKPTAEPARAFATVEASNQRRTHARTAVMFAALAAEAYVNEFLATMLNGGDFRAMDRLPTVEKYVVGCRLAPGEALFDRGREPVQTIASLFKLRDKLVHPKAGHGHRVRRLMRQAKRKPFSRRPTPATSSSQWPRPPALSSSAPIPASISISRRTSSGTVGRRCSSTQTAHRGRYLHSMRRARTRC